MGNEEIGKLTVHQFRAKVEFLNKMFSDNKQEEKPSTDYSILDKAFGVR